MSKEIAFLKTVFSGEGLVIRGSGALIEGVEARHAKLSGELHDWTHKDG
jgi:hypothetical protein